jgi:predicted 3-demethylubiquinone-9 3-methyltransferase (glyoxalase superfamily)
MQKITPFLWFDKEARAAAEFYVSVFKDAQILGSSTLKDTPSGTVEIVTLRLFDKEYQLMSAGPLFKFNEAISFVVNCETQEETDYYWKKLSAVPESEACGWLKDRFGVSWQIVPKQLTELLSDPDPARAGRVMQAMLQMKKIDIACLQQAYDAE